MAVVGAGSLAHQVINIMMSAGTLSSSDSFALFDDGPDVAAGFGQRVVSVRPFSHWASSSDFDTAVVGVGYRHLTRRLEIVRALRERGVGLPNAVHSSAVICGTMPDGAAVYIWPRATVDFEATIEEGAMMHVGAVVCHDSVLGAASYLSPGALVCGNVHVGQRCFVGAGAVVRDGVRIGNDVVVAMAASVVCDLSDGVRAAGSPARLVSDLRL